MSLAKSTKKNQKWAWLMIVIIVNQICFPTISLALTSGPTQPELQSFEPVGASEMVDLFSGDFSYNIPLFELPGPNGGYPVNLFYNSVTSADEEASIVGLGWNLGIGAINRQMRGLPDDFDGEIVERQLELKPQTTVGVGTGVSIEVVGGDFALGLAEYGLSVSLGFTVLYDSYKGLGFSVDPGVSVSMGPSPGNGGLGLSSGFGMSFNSLNGVSANASVGVSTKNENGGSFGAGLGLGLDSREGMSMALSSSFSTNNKNSKIRDTKGRKKGINGVGGGASYDLSYNRPAYTPQVDMEFSGFNFSTTFEIGIAVTTVEGPKFSGHGFFSNRELLQHYVSTPAFGAMYHQNAVERSLQDFNREKDAPIRFQQPYLAIPSLTSDALSVTGHGIGGTYQLYRSDVPFFSDQATLSQSGGFSIGVDVGPSITFHLGFSGSGNYSEERTIRPFTNRGNIGAHGESPETNPSYEPYFFKAVGELTGEEDPNSTYAYMGVNEPVKLNMNGVDFGTSFKTKSGAGLPDVKGRSERKTRAMSIQPITNATLLDTLDEELLPEFDVKFYDLVQDAVIDQTDYVPSNLEELNRSQHAPKQIAGYTTISEDGARWNFALPARNNTQVDATFSVATPAQPSCTKSVNVATTGSGGIYYNIPNTDEFLSKTTLPAYSHAYMLTSIYGSDYIDVNSNDGGPNDLDKGYWMNIDYVRTSDSYAWRAPFTKASYMQGAVNKNDDDKAMFTYGEREQYHPAKMTTRTHVAEFYYSKRNDGRAAGDWLQNNNSSLGDYSYKLDKVSIFSKEELAAADEEGRDPIAMKNVHFTYSYELCDNVENNGVGTGKLTLKSVYFTYENTSRGSLNPYKFEYNNSNEDYEELAFDRWGIFRPAPGGDICYNIHTPFVNQLEDKATLDAQAATWHLTDIFLPSGAHIEINVERDQYSHEQNRVAGRMFNIAGINTYGENALAAYANPSSSDMTIYFDLDENHIAEATGHNSNAAVRQEIDRYFEDLYQDGQGKQLYFQVRSDLLNSGGSGTDHYETVTGYTYIQEYGVVESSVYNNHYTKGYIQLKPLPVKVDGNDFHPFLISAWQYIKSNLGDKMYAAPASSSSDSEEQAIGRILSIFGQIAGLFRGYYYYASDAGFGTIVDLERSFIRLASPNLKMYGGGVRVNKVTIEDDWSDEDTPIYGTVYEYEEEEKYINAHTGNQETRIISSGTATTTPVIGKQESSLRYARQYVEDLTNRQDKMYFFEHPLNESYYQGASVGYRKVTVKSLASEYAIKTAKGQTPPSELTSLPTGFATSGVTVHEFYTAKEFPVVTKNTVIQDWTNPAKYIPIPLIGSIKIDQYTGTQGYTVEINNMHGKPYKVSNYAQDINGHIIKTPISSIQYDYLFDEKVETEGKKSRKYKVLNNTVPILLSDLDPNDFTKAEFTANAELGVEREFFVDVRETSSRSGNAGVALNVDLASPFPPIPVFSGWGNIGYAEQLVRTAVTNKVIRRSGILIKTTAYDGQSKVITDNKIFNRYTGQPVLTTVNNSYDDLVYNYTIPAHVAYNRMGSSAKNWNLSFVADIQAIDNTGYYPIDMATVSSEELENLVEGDEFIMESWPISSTPTVKTRATLVKKITTETSSSNALYLAIDASSTPANESYYFKVVRSGNRNHLNASVGSITSLSDPTINRTNNTLIYNSDEASLTGDTVVFSPNGNDTTSYRKLNNVLAIGATTYSDAWAIEDVDCTTIGDSLYGKNSFRNGTRGIFRAYDTWTYVANRDQSTPINTKVDGAMDEVPLFDWKNPFVAYSAPYEKWKKTQTITKYSADANELESKNIIGLYGAAIYAYGDNLPIAIGNNTSYHEMGFEGFEEYPPKALSDTSLKEKGNILFIDRTSDCSIVRRQYTLLSNLNRSSEGVVVDADYYSNFPTPVKAIFNLTHIDGSVFTIEYQIQDVYPYYDSVTGKNYVYLEFNTTTPIGNSILPMPTSSDKCTHLKGTAMLYFQQDRPFKNTPLSGGGGNYGVLISNEEAHTGKHSLAIKHQGEGSGTPPAVSFQLPQNNLLLRADSTKKYVFSTWVKVNNTDTYTYDGKLVLTIGNDTINPVGPIIDGWQRMEGIFTLKTSVAVVTILLLTYNMYYFDDIRIFPSEGNMQSYVYDPVTYKLRATLDNNNYFTRYLYDKQGSLIAVQKETPKGIKTIQETGSFTKETN